MLPQAIIFDWDNTLVDVQSSLDFALMHTMNDMGHEINDKEINSNRRSYSSKEKFLKTQFKSNWQKASMIYGKHIRRAPTGGVSLFDNAKKVLQFTLDNQIPTVVVSNKCGVNLRIEIEQLNLSKYFASIIGSGDTEQDKPSVLPATTALEQIAIKPNKNVWFIGDNITDMECARKLGVIKILYGVTDFDDIIIDSYVKDHYQLLTLLQNSVNQDNSNSKLDLE